MKWDEFILKIADEHNIDGAAKDFFLLRFGEDHIHDNDTQFKVFLEESETRQRALGKEDTSNKISSPNNFKIRETNPVSAFNKQIRSVYEKLDVSLSGIKDPYAKKKPDRLRRWLREEYDKESSSLRIFQPERNIDSEVLCEACYRLLETQRRVTTNSLMSKDGVTFEPDDLFVPLGLVERKKRPRRQDIESSDQGSQLYEATIDEITQTFTHQEFFDQVIRHGETKSQGKRIAIVGEPGAGKTTLLQKIGDWFRDNDQVPIWVSLADVGTKSLREYLLEDWLQNAAETIEPPSQEWKTALQQLLKSNQACLLLDGVDEMVVPNALRWIGEQLREGWVSSVRVVLTCRLNVWENSVLEGFDVYRNLDFDYPEQVRCFIDQFFKREGADPSLGEKLKEELEKSGKERIRDSIKNPLRLSLLCYSWEIESGELPATKAELYRQFVNAFYELKQKEFPITPEQQQELNQALGQLARASIDREDSRFRLRESFIKNLLGGDPQQEDTLFWKACRLGLLNYIGITAEKPHEKAYAFIHPTFQEYFAAISIESWKVFVGSILNEENEIHQESQKAKSNLRMLLPEWKEIISLWLGIISDDKHEREKKDFIEYVFKFQDNHYNNRVGYYTLLLISHWLEDYSKDEYINQLEEACEYLIREAFGRNSKLDKSSDLAFQALLKLPLRFVVEPLIKRVDFDDEHQIIHSDILHDWILEDRGGHPANSWEIRCQFSTLNDRDSFDDWFESEFYWNFRWLEALEALSIVGKGDSEVEKIIKDIILYCNEEYCNYPQELVEFLWFYWAEKDPRKLLDLYKELWVDIEKKLSDDELLDVITHMSWVWEANRKINDKTANKNKITMLDAKDVEAFLSNRSELILASQRETMRSAEEDYYCLLDEQFTLQVLESLDIDLNVCLLPIKINFWLDSDYAGLASLKYLWDRISIKAVPDKFPPKISDLGDFDRNLIGLKVNLKIERLVIILYQTEAHHELVEILKGVSDIVYVGWITDQPVPFRSFHPESTNLGSAIQSWLDEISQE